MRSYLKKIPKKLRHIWFVITRLIGIKEDVDPETGETKENYQTLYNFGIVNGVLTCLGFILFGSTFSIPILLSITTGFLILAHLDKAIEITKLDLKEKNV